MAAKLTYQDVFNDELAPEKFIPSPDYFDTGVIDPTYSAPCGSLYVNTASGSFFLNVSSPTPGTSWIKLHTIASSIQIGHHRTAIEPGITITGASNYSPVVGDLVGVFGVGAWSAAANLNHTFLLNNATGRRYSAITVGSDGTTNKLCELYNSVSWANTGNLNVNRYQPYTGGVPGTNKDWWGNIFGSQNGSICFGGYDGTNVFSSTEFYNGSTWINTSAISNYNVNFSTDGAVNGSACGSSCAGIAIGHPGLVLSVPDSRFNGISWLSTNGFSFSDYTTLAGSANSAIGISGGTGFTTPRFYLNNGITWIHGCNTALTYNQVSLNGNPLAAQKVGGVNTGTTNAITISELYNGNNFIAGNNLNTGRISAGSSASGNSSICLIAAGRATWSSTVITGLNSSESYIESDVYKKVYPQYIKNYKKVALYIGANSLLNQGYTSTIIYPPNKYIVVNRSGITASGNETNISAGYTVLLVGVAGSIATYSISTTPGLQIVPGNIAIVTAGGANPLTANNIGVFVVKNIIVSSNTVAVTNPAGTSQNPGTGTVKFLTSILAIDTINSDDIVVGTTNSDGILTIDKLFKTINYLPNVGF